MSDHTPMMQQYRRIKATCPDAILMVRIGDFYEMMEEDAVTASRVLEITLTRKHVGKGATVPLAGVPYHAVQSYIFRLTRAGYRVALCDQVEDPKQTKKLVKRAITRTITPGTIIDADVIDGGVNNYLAAIDDRHMEGIGFAYADVSTGEFQCVAFEGPQTLINLSAELSKVNPAEVLFPSDSAAQSTCRALVRQETEAKPWDTDPAHYDAERALSSPLAVLAPDGKPVPHENLPLKTRLALSAAAGLLAYIQETQQKISPHLTEMRLYETGEHMHLDASTERNLEILRNNRDGTRTGSLLSVLDETRTPMGSRLLKRWLVRPLTRVDAIQKRLDVVEALVNEPARRERLAESLGDIGDMERLVGRICFGNANARDLAALRRSLAALPEVNACLDGLLPPAPEHPDLLALLKQAIVEDPPFTVREGGMIRDGYCAELDELRGIATSGKDWIARMQAAEREKTGIPSLRISYNKVFGYYIEVTRAHQEKVPASYIRKQTLVNAERYITPELKEYEEKVLHAQERITDLEYRLFTALIERVQQDTESIKAAADRVAEGDVLAGFAAAALQRDYTRPEVDLSDALAIRDGRHPVIEAVQTDLLFVANDTLLDNGERQLCVLTGPNMAGKSTYIRQVALIVLMAQAGSFVPAKSARLGVVDRVFSRVGASDNIARGQSTFMVEMSETAAILKSATPRSLIILDEIGRGTSTYDGVSLAWAIAEYIHDIGRKGVKTLFATHYHELADLESRLDRCFNSKVLVAEQNGRITFLYRVIPGASDHSYGIHVAELAGIPERVLKRARKVLKSLEDETFRKEEGTGGALQMSLFASLSDPFRERIAGLDIENMTPVQAMTALAELVNEARRPSS